jgi:hypothetical protein
VSDEIFKLEVIDGVEREFVMIDVNEFNNYTITTDVFAKV